LVQLCVQKTFQPIAILSFISSGLIIIFSLIFRPNNLFINVIDPYWIYWLYDGANIFQHIFFRMAALLVLASVIGAASIFMFIALKLINGRRIRIEFFYAAVGLLFVETFVNTFIFVFFINLPEGIWVFIENSTGFPRYGSSIFGLIHNFFGIFISHIIAIVLLVLAMKNRYLLNTLPVGSILVKKSQPVNSVNRAQGQYRECPFCAETVLAKAKLCKHCRSKI
jgi:hypothetical protein